MSTLTSQSTRQQLENLGHDIIVNAYESWMHHWAVSNGTYKWGTEKGLHELHGDAHFASVTVYDMEACEQVEDDTDIDENEGFWSWGAFYKFGAPLYIDQSIVADFIEKVGRGEFDQSQVPDYGQLSQRTLNALAGAYLFGEDGIDAFQDIADAPLCDAIVQVILLGEVVYG